MGFLRYSPGPTTTSFKIEENVSLIIGWWNVSLCNLFVIELLCWRLGPQLETVLKLSNIGSQLVTRQSGRETALTRFKRLFKGNLNAWLNKISKKQVAQAVEITIKMTLYCQEDKCVNKMFLFVLLDNGLFVKCLIGERLVHKILNSHANNNSALE